MTIRRATINEHAASASGQQSNLDKTRAAIVKRGCTVRYGVQRGKVARVRMGQCIVNLWGNDSHAINLACSVVEVVA